MLDLCPPIWWLWLKKFPLAVDLWFLPQYFFIVADTLMAFDNQICAYLDFDFDGQNNAFIVLIYFPKSPRCLCCELTLDFRSLLTLPIIVNPQYKYPRTFPGPQILSENFHKPWTLSGVVRRTPSASEEEGVIVHGDLCLKGHYPDQTIEQNIYHSIFMVLKSSRYNL